MSQSKEVNDKFDAAIEKLCHVASVLNSGLDPIQPKLRRSLDADLAYGLGLLGQGLRLHLDHIEQKLSSLAREMKKG